MTRIWIDSRKGCGGPTPTSSLTSARRCTCRAPPASVFKIRVADMFLSTDRGTYLYSQPRSAETLPARLTYDGNRLILNDQELRAQFSRKRQLFRGRDTQQGSEHKPPSRPQLRQRSRQPAGFHLCADAAVLGGVPALQQPGQCRRHRGPAAPRHHREDRLQAGRRIMETDTHENHLVNVRGPITLHYLRFRLTDYEGNVVDLRGTSLSFCIYLDG